MKGKKKIILLGPASPFRGGIADTQVQLALNLQELGHEVLVYTFTTQYPKILFPGKTQFSREKPPEGVHIRRRIHSFNPFNWSKVAQSINRQQPHFVIFRYWTPFLAPCWNGISRGLKKGIKKIGLVDNWIPHETRPWDNFLRHFFSKSMDGFATLSDSVGEQIKSDLENRAVWQGFHPIADELPPPISKEKARARLGWPTDKKIVLFFGLIRKYKGLDLLIEAFACPPLEDKSVILAIVGELYEPKEKYTQLIKKLKLNQRVICDFEYANAHKAAAVFCATDVIAQTYTSATQSGVTPLAYRYQTPILASDLPGLSAPVTKDQTGKVTEINPGKIAKNLSQLLEDSALCDFKVAFQSVQTDYSWKRFGQSLMKFLGEL